MSFNSNLYNSILKHVMVVCSNPAQGKIPHKVFKHYIFVIEKLLLLQKFHLNRISTRNYINILFQVVEVKDIGVLVTLYPGMAPALVHNTQLDHRKVSFCDNSYWLWEVS